MCGLACIFTQKEIINDDQLIYKMMDEVSNRGPDGEGFYKDNNIHLGHKRLSIIDLNSNSNQPFVWANRYVIVFNGEIYNYKFLKEKLQKKGFQFKTNSDTEVLIASFDYWGQECLNMLNGMWSFIIWDKKLKRLFACRDRFGIKPLYYSFSNNKLLISSEIKQINKALHINSPNYDQLSVFLYTGISNFDNETCFKGINILPAGSYLKISLDKNLEIRKWYSLRDNLNYSSSINDLQYLLTDSIKLRMQSDRPVGYFLSGGLDSSTVCTYASSIAQKNLINIFHAKSADKEFDEFYFAKKCSEKLNCKLHKIVPSKEDFLQNINNISYLQDEPFASTSIFMQYLLFKEASQQGLKVILDGQGADEILLGYLRYLPLPLFESLAKKDLKNIFKSLKDFIMTKSISSYKQKTQYFFGSLLSDLRTTRVNNKFNFVNLSISKSKYIYKEISSNLWDHQNTQINEITKVSLPSLLRYADRNSMSNSVEVRLPFLDHRLVETCVSLSLNNKINKGWTKYALRNNKLLANEVAWRRSKLGFDSPERTWINHYQDIMYETILESKIMNNIVNQKILKNNWKTLSVREKWRVFSVANWAKVMNIN